MKKVCIVVPPNLPMPAIKGGAIETLLQNIIDINEIKKDCNLTVISLYDESAEQEAKKYKYTKFIYFKPKRFDKIKYFMFRVFRKVFALQLNYLESYEYFVTQIVLNGDYDIFINESADFKAFKAISKKLGRENCFAHLHSEFLSSNRIDATYGTIISVSKYIKNQWLKSSNINPQNIKILYNFADNKIFAQDTTKEDNEKLKIHLGLSKDDFIVIFCGRIVPQKGILELIKAIKLLDNKKIKLLIVGSPNFGKNTRTAYQDEVIKEVKNSKGRIIFTGFVNHNQLFKYYNISSCAVVPSTYEDPAPLVAIESMAAEKPLIVTNSGGMPEYVNTDCAIIVEKESNLEKKLSEAIILLFNNKLRRTEMAINAKRRSLEFTKDKYYNNYLHIIGIL